MNGGAPGTARSRHPHVPGASPGYATPHAAPPQRALGRIKWFDRERKQYGFITPADGSADVFVHAGDVLGSTKMIGPGDAVEFDYGLQPQSGRPKALMVVRLIQHIGDDDEDDGRTTIGRFATGDEPLFDAARITGRIARFDAQHRWGFISPDDDTLKPPGGGDNFFLHGLDVLDLSDAHPVDVGQAVEFAVVRSRTRRCKAVQCVRIGENRPESSAATASPVSVGEPELDDKADEAAEVSSGESAAGTPTHQPSKSAKQPAPAGEGDDSVVPSFSHQPAATAADIVVD